MRHSRRRQFGIAEEPARNEFRKASLVLSGIVKHQLGKSAVALVRGERVKLMTRFGFSSRVRKLPCPRNPMPILVRTCRLQRAGRSRTSEAIGGAGAILIRAARLKGAES